MSGDDEKEEETEEEEEEESEESAVACNNEGEATPCSDAATVKTAELVANPARSPPTVGSEDIRNAVANPSFDRARVATASE